MNRKCAWFSTGIKVARSPYRSAPERGRCWDSPPYPRCLRRPALGSRPCRYQPSSRGDRRTSRKTSRTSPARFQAPKRSNTSCCCAFEHLVQREGGHQVELDSHGLLPERPALHQRTRDGAFIIGFGQGAPRRVRVDQNNSAGQPA